jgi:Tol biopolymer transport system component
MKKFVRIFLVIIALCVLTSIAVAQQNKSEQLYQQALFDMEGKGDYAKAIESFTLVMTKFPKEKATAAKALLNIGRCYEKLGKNEAQKAYERIIKDFKDQTLVVAEARARLETLKQSEPSKRLILPGSPLGAPSKDGRYFSMYYPFNNSLLISELKTGKTTFIANPDSSRKGMYIMESVWSPDGKQLAYGLGGLFKPGNQSEIHLINTDGSGHRVLCTKTDTGKGWNNIWVQDWSRDGKMILAVFGHFSKVPFIDIRELVVVFVDDGSIRLIKILDNWSWELPTRKIFFSPDNRFIVWSAPTEKGGKTNDVFVIGVDGKNEMNITQHSANDIALGWEPNGNRLLFASDRGVGRQDLWAIKMVNGKPQGFPKLIMNNIDKIFPYGLTDDGSFYYLVIGDELTNIGTSFFSFTESNIYLASLDPQTGKILSEPKAATMKNNGFNHNYSWSPDGKELLYFSYFGNGPESPRKFFILSPETGVEKEILHQLGKDVLFGSSDWFPDGKYLASYVQMPSGENGIYKLEIETEKMTPLVTSKDTIFTFPKVSPDGKIVYFQSNRRIYSYDLERKERELLFKCGMDQYFRNFGLSQDGRKLAFVLETFRPKPSEALMVMLTSGGEPQEIFRVEAAGFFSKFSEIRWSPDGRYIYFVKGSEWKAKYELFRVSIQGGTPESTGLVNEGLHNFSIRPDGKEIAFCAGMVQSKSGVWVQENVFGEKEEIQK